MASGDEAPDSPNAAAAEEATKEIEVPAANATELPADDELTYAVTEILTGADLDEMTVRKLMAQLEKKYKTTLTSKKAFIKATMVNYIQKENASDSGSAMSSSGGGSDGSDQESEGDLAALFAQPESKKKKGKAKKAAPKRKRKAAGGAKGGKAKKKKKGDKEAQDKLRAVFGDSSSSDDSDASSSEEVVRTKKKRKAPAKKRSTKVAVPAATTRSRRGASRKDAAQRNLASATGAGTGADLSDSGGPTDSSDNSTKNKATADDLAFIDKTGESSSEDDDEVIRTEKRPEYSDEEGEGGEPQKELDEFDQLLERIKPKRGGPKYTEMQKGQIALKFLDEMKRAAKADQDSNRKGEPGVNKLKLLPEVKARLNKLTFQDAFLNHGVFTVLRQWLFPLPDKSLPSTLVRTEILQLLLNFPFDLAQLRSSGVGKIINFLSKSELETEENKKKCRAIMARWSRPIYNLSTNMKDLTQEHVGPSNRATDEPAAPKTSKTAVTGVTDDTGLEVRRGARPGEPGYVAHVRIPIPMTMHFKNRPEQSSKMGMNPKSGQFARNSLSHKQKQLAKKVDSMKPPSKGDKTSRYVKVFDQR